MDSFSLSSHVIVFFLVTTSQTSVESSQQMQRMSEDLVRMGEDRCEERERQTDRETESELGKRRMQEWDAGGEGKGFRRGQQTGGRRVREIGKDSGSEGKRMSERRAADERTAAARVERSSGEKR